MTKRKPPSRSDAQSRPQWTRRGAKPWKHGSLPVIGLMGGIGAGKSTVARLMAAAGAHVLDADTIGHALLDQTPVRTRVVEKFGAGVVLGDNPAHVDRKSLGAIVFNNPDALRTLEDILHPRMRQTFEKAIARQQRLRTAKAVVLDAAILLEAGWDDLCDIVVFVDAPQSIRRERVRASRGWDVPQIEARERSQWGLDRKQARADVVVSNRGGEEELAAEIEGLWTLLRSRFRQSMARLHAAGTNQTTASQTRETGSRQRARGTPPNRTRHR